jgi:hypothetical protein
LSAKSTSFTRRRRHPGAHDVAEGFDGPSEDVAVEEEERAERLRLRGGRDVLPRGEVREEGVDLGLAQLVRGALAVEGGVALHPADVRLLGAQAVMPRAERGAEAV